MPLWRTWEGTPTLAQKTGDWGNTPLAHLEGTPTLAQKTGDWGNTPYGAPGKVRLL